MSTTGRIRQVALGVAVGLLVALGALGVSADDAAARPKRTQEQQQFVDNCRETGGTPRRVGPRTVKCTWPSGNSSTCNFETGVCTVVSQMERRAGGGPSTGPGTSGPNEPVGSESTGDASVDADSIVPLD